MVQGNLQVMMRGMAENYELDYELWTRLWTMDQTRDYGLRPMLGLGNQKLGTVTSQAGTDTHIHDESLDRDAGDDDDTDDEGHCSLTTTCWTSGDSRREPLATRTRTRLANL